MYGLTPFERNFFDSVNDFDKALQRAAFVPAAQISERTMTSSSWSPSFPALTRKISPLTSTATHLH